MSLLDAIDTWCADNPDATRVPRSLGPHPLTIGGHTGTRKLATFTQWMAQRSVDTYEALEGAERDSADAWLDRVGGQGMKDLRIRNRQVRVDFKLVLEAPPAAV